jgi:hypothetical protein
MWYHLIAKRTSLASPWLLLLVMKFDIKLLQKARTATVKANSSKREEYRHTVPDFESIRMLTSRFQHETEKTFLIIDTII